MNIFYNKNDNTKLFHDFINCNIIDNSNCITNYIPIYNKFFNLNINNFDKINLNQKNMLNKINNVINDNNYYCEIKDNFNNITNKNIFIKFSPIIDITKYLTGKYSDSELVLPDINNISNKKIRDYNNSAYIESFFYYLSSLLLNNYSFINGIDFYGSYLAFKNNFKADVMDDIDILLCNNNFNNNINKLFSIEDNYVNLLNDDTRKYKNKLNLNIDISDNILSNLDELDIFDNIFIDNNNFKNDILIELSNNYFKIDDNKKKIINESDSEESGSEESDSEESGSEESDSEESGTEESGSEESGSEESGSESESDDSYIESDCSDETINININKFPVQIITLEKCKNTFDYLINNSTISDEELSCIVLQILMILITYQKTFNFTHNDLHTNNIMFIETKVEDIIYKINNKCYKIKTYGKIFKIIDFGRSIYNYKNRLMCSDSYHKEGDAASQYNFKPYYNPKKNIVKPNSSFDLCRLGCSLYDYYIDDINSIKKTSEIKKIICDWCNDDLNKNILYKKNGDERYPDFKLYKMIARTVSKQVPLDILNKEHFNKYIISNISDDLYVIDIDSIPICI